jgi:serine/threonine protein kinase
MGQFISLCCLLTCPRQILKDEALLYKGNNSAIYELPDNKVVCKVVHNYNMFLRELKFIQQMKQHTTEQHIIRYYNVIPGHSIFLMERAEQDLLGWMKTHFRDPDYLRQLRVWMGQLASGFRFLLNNRIEHYDIKPDNLLLVGNVLKIADFGTCQLERGSYTLYTGTYGFIAPEIMGLTNKEYYVPHSMDVYSICVMMMYLQFAPVFKKFYNKNWTLEHYLLLEQYVNTKYPSTFYKNGLVVDQRYRLSISHLLDMMHEEARKVLEPTKNTDGKLQRHNTK